MGASCCKKDDVEDIAQQSSLIQPLLPHHGRPILVDAVLSSSGIAVGTGNTGTGGAVALTAGTSSIAAAQRLAPDQKSVGGSQQSSVLDDIGEAKEAIEEHHESFLDLMRLENEAAATYLGGAMTLAAAEHRDSEEEFHGEWAALRSMFCDQLLGGHSDDEDSMGGGARESKYGGGAREFKEGNPESEGEDESAEGEMMDEVSRQLSSFTINAHNFISNNTILSANSCINDSFFNDVTRRSTSQ
jgi:hypothetical protein